MEGSHTGDENGGRKASPQRTSGEPNNKLVEGMPGGACQHLMPGKRTVCQRALSIAAGLPISARTRFRTSCHAMTTRASNFRHRPKRVSLPLVGCTSLLMEA